MKYTILFIVANLLIPSVVLAQVGNVFDAEVLVYGLLRKFGYLLYLIAIMVFFWGIVKFISHAGDSKEHENGKALIVWGLISFLVLVSLWAIVRFIVQDTLFIPNSDPCYVDRNGTQICP